MERGRAAAATDRLCEPQQLGDAALYGVAKGLLQSGGVGGRDHSNEPAPWSDSGGQRRRFLRHAIYQHVSWHPPGVSDEARVYPSEKGTVLCNGAARDQRCSTTER